MRRQIFMCSYVFCTTYIVLGYAGFTTTKIGPQPLWNATHTDKLRQDLLLNYDKFARPSQHYNTTVVNFALVIRHIELNELKSTLNVHAWIMMKWIDEKLKWNSSDYDNLDSVRLADHEIWQPDIFLYNSATSSGISHYGNTLCVVMENGLVIWEPPTIFSVLCNLNLKYWPFDEQECMMKFGSWTYTGDQIDFEVDKHKEETEIDLFIQNNEWDIKESFTKLSHMYIGSMSYPDISVSLKIARRSASYSAVIISPAFVIMFSILLSFWLPPQAGEKIVINSCVALIICLFLLYFTRKIPAIGSHVPLIVLFYSTSLYIVALSIMESVIVIWLSRTKHSRALPWVIKQPLTGTFGKLLGLNTYIQQSSISTHRVTAEEMRDHHTDFEDHSDEHQIIKSSTKSSIQQDWILLAAAIDRMLFCFYSLLFAILAIVYSL